MRLNTTWPGTSDELVELVSAVRRHCSCGSANVPSALECPAHALLLADQTGISRLLFARRIVGRLRFEEWQVPENQGQSS